MPFAARGIIIGHIWSCLEGCRCAMRSSRVATKKRRFSRWQGIKVVSLSDRIAYFSICSLNYLHYARTLAQSLAAAEPSIDFHLFIADRWNERIVRSAPELRAIPLSALGVPHLLDMAFRYQQIEFNTALKPLCIEFLFDHRGYHRVVYLDPDIFVLKPLSHIAEMFAGGADCILTPHITRPIDDGRRQSELDLMRSGTFNLGFCAFAHTPDARSFIAWWRGKLVTQCLVEPDCGIFVDQRYCDLAPAFIARTAILRHPGYNLAYWNLSYRPVTRVDGEYRTGGEPVHFVHFSGIEPQNPDSVSKHQNRFRRSDLGEFGFLYDDYLDRLRANSRSPDGSYSDITYGFGTMRLSGLRVEPWMRRYYRALYPAPVQGSDPFSLPAEFFAPAEPKPPKPTEEAMALAELSKLARSPKLLIKSLFRVLWKGEPRAVDYWQRRAVPPSAPEAATRSEPASPLARGAAIYGLFRAITGLGQAVRGASLALISAGYPVSCHDIRLGDAAATEPFDIDPGFANRFDTVLLWLNADNTLRLDSLVPAEAIMGRHCIGYWVWELPVFPAAWARAFDRIDEVWVPSAYVAASVAAATTKPVRIVPHVVNPPALDRAAARARFGVREDEILFSCVFDQRSYLARKNPEAAVRAFIDAFPDRRAAVRLLIKCNGGMDDSLREVAVLVPDHPGITLIASVLSREETWLLHAACDIHVSLHRAEGFGLNIAEAMALGKLAIVTNFSGNTDFTTADNTLLVDFDMRRVALHDYPQGEGQWWADPRHDAAVDAMRTAYRDAALRRRLGDRARQDIERFSLRAVGHRMASLLGQRERRE